MAGAAVSAPATRAMPAIGFHQRPTISVSPRFHYFTAKDMGADTLHKGWRPYRLHALAQPWPRESPARQGLCPPYRHSAQKTCKTKLVYSGVHPPVTLLR